jgi:hypothetical protein
MHVTERKRNDQNHKHTHTHIHTFSRAKSHIDRVNLPLLKGHVVHLLVHVLPKDDHLVPVDDIPGCKKEGGMEGGREGGETS